MAEWDEHDQAAQASSGNGGIYQESGFEGMDPDRVRQEVDRYVGIAADYIRQRPVASLFSAIAIGFLVGRIARRR